MANQKQIELAEKLQMKALEYFENGFDTGTLTATDVSTLVRLLSQNGWVLDPARVPQGLRDKLTSTLDPSDLEDDGDVIPIIRKRRA